MCYTPSATLETGDFARPQMDAHSHPRPTGGAQQTVQSEHQHFQLREASKTFQNQFLLTTAAQMISSSQPGTTQPPHRPAVVRGEVQQRRRGLALVPDHAVTCVPCSTDRELASLEPPAPI